MLEVNTVAGLPINCPEIQISVVDSKKAFNGDAIVPNRVGDPKAVSYTHLTLPTIYSV